jgi:uncharacterized protein
MNDKTLENLFSKLFNSSFIDNTGVDFLWHAGEPLLAGLEFYKKAIDFITKYNIRKLPVTHSIQTNGILINEKWCEFFFKNDFNVGLSVDGPEFLHDINRVTWGGKPSHKKVMDKFCLLRQYGITSGALCVLTREHLKYPKLILDFFTNNDFPSVGFNIEEIENDNTSSSLNKSNNEIIEDVKSEYRNFISVLYDEWLPHSGKFDIREFQDLFNVIHKKLTDPNYIRIPDEVADLGIITIHNNGDISTYSPEFAGAKDEKYNDFIFGNVNSIDFDSLANNEVLNTIIRDVNEHKTHCKKTCSYFSICGGSYVSNVYFETSDITNSESTACILMRQITADVLFDKLTKKKVSDKITMPNKV